MEALLATGATLPSTVVPHAVVAGPSVAGPSVPGPSVPGPSVPGPSVSGATASGAGQPGLGQSKAAEPGAAEPVVRNGSLCEDCAARDVREPFGEDDIQHCLLRHHGTGSVPPFRVQLLLTNRFERLKREEFTTLTSFGLHDKLKKTAVATFDGPWRVKVGFPVTPAPPLKLVLKECKPLLVDDMNPRWISARAEPRTEGDLRLSSVPVAISSVQRAANAFESHVYKHWKRWAARQEMPLKGLMTLRGRARTKELLTQMGQFTFAHYHNLGAGQIVGGDSVHEATLRDHDQTVLALPVLAAAQLDQIVSLKLIHLWRGFVELLQWRILDFNSGDWQAIFVAVACLCQQVADMKKDRLNNRVKGPYMSAKSFEDSEKALNLILTRFHLYSKRFDRDRLVRRCLPSVREFYNKHLGDRYDKLDGTAECWFRELTAASDGWYAKPTFASKSHA